MRATVCLALAALCLQAAPEATATAATETAIETAAGPGVGTTVHRFAAQVLAARNNQGLPFLVIDKVQATVWVFSGQGKLPGSSAVLLGLAIGDDSVPGIGQRKLATIRPEERTTPAGRFVSSLGRNLLGQEVLWVDYDNGVSLHRVIHGLRSERRAERLASPTPDDNRVSYGCINVPAAFFDALVLPTVRPHGSIVYVLPETRALQQVFGFLPGASVR
jgi:hypothetical protein